MTGLSKTLGRGLLILALGSCAFACGDDDGGDRSDGGAGSDGGGAGSAGDDGGAGSSGGSCEADAKAVTMDRVDDACLTCACTEGADEVAACDATCWALIDCFSDPAKCGTVDRTDMGAAVTCITMSCPDVDLAMASASSTPATALGAVLSASCATQCAPAGTTDGGMGGSGGDMDGGDADGG